MKTCIFLFTFLISTKIFAQVVTDTIQDGNARIKEVYGVSKTDPRSKEGRYVSCEYYSRGDTICKGFFKNNLKDSLWIYYSYGHRIIDSGFYKEGKKTGIWKAYKSNGPLELQYDFSNKLLMYYKRDPDDREKKYAVVDGHKKLYTILDRPPIYLDGTEGFIHAITIRVGFPGKARENNISGKVIVSFIIDEQGRVSDYKIKKSLGYGLDEDAMQAVESANGEWLPAILNGKTVSVAYEMPVSYQYGN